MATSSAVLEKTSAPARKIIFACPLAEADAFDAFAARAAQAGASHVVITEGLPKSFWQWEMMGDDPYPNWSMLNPSLFKVCPPPELAEWIPREYSQHCLDILVQRTQTLNRLGLKAAFHGGEPAWLPEGVYEAHPSWRGPRVEHPLRARHAYYSPCIDNEEVLRMYRWAAAELCRQVPVDAFYFLTNDSGNGICWSESLYPGRNGPPTCEHIPIADRVCKFFNTIQAGAADAGRQTTIRIQYGAGVVSRAEVTSIVAKLGPGQAINGLTRNGSAPILSAGENPAYNTIFPLRGIPLLVRLAGKLDAAFATPTTDMLINIPDAGADAYYALFQAYAKNPAQGYAARIVKLSALATEGVGATHAETLLDCWHRVHSAVEAIAQLGEEPLIELGVVNQRWLNRPFVPFPLELSENESSYYKPYQFQANSAAEAADLMNLQGYKPVQGASAALLSSLILNPALENLKMAKDNLSNIAASIEDADTRRKLTLMGRRIQALGCFFRTARNAIQYQAILDQTDYTVAPVQKTLHRVDGDQRLRELQNITRSEIENMNELIEVLGDAPQEILLMAPTAEREDIFLFGPALVPQLREKVRTMLRHQLDAYRLYERRQG
jgi:hypothetical protein